MPPAQPVGQRKRTRKRKRRVASSSSSSSSSSDSESDTSQQVSVKVTAPRTTQQLKADSSSSSSSSSSESEVESDDGHETILPQALVTDPQEMSFQDAGSRPPTPAPVELPTIFPQAQGMEASVEVENEMKSKFRKFWMSAVADGFRDDLEEIRKEPNFGSSKLAMLIDSLASSADVFTSANPTDIKEYEIALQ